MAATGAQDRDSYGNDPFPPAIPRGSRLPGGASTSVAARPRPVGMRSRLLGLLGRRGQAQPEEVLNRGNPLTPEVARRLIRDNEREPLRVDKTSFPPRTTRCHA